MNINPDDLRINTYSNSSGCAVRIVHVPTGIVATSSEHAGQHAAREQAMRRLEQRLADYGNPAEEQT